MGRSLASRSGEDEAQIPIARSRLDAALRLSRLAALVVLASGGLLFAGWSLYEAAAIRLFPALTPMTPNTALGLAILAAGLLVSLSPQTRLAPLGRFLGVAVAMLAAATLAQALFDLDLGIDGAFFGGEPATGRFSRMAPNTAIALALLGMATAFLDRETRHGRRPAQWLALLGGAIAVHAVIGYAFGARFLYDVGSYTSMAISTAALLVLLAVATIFARPDRGLAGVFLRDTPGGLMMRSLLPGGALIVFVLGLLETAGLDAGLFDVEIGLAGLVIGIVAMLFGLIWFSARSLDEYEGTARAAERERARLLIHEHEARGSAEVAERRYRDLLEGLTEIVWERDPQTMRFTFVSERAERMLGYPVRRLLDEPGFWIETIVHPEDRDSVRARYLAAPSESVAGSVEYRAVAADGRVLWLRDAFRFTVADRDRPGLRGLTMNVTQAKQAASRVAAQHAVTRVLSESASLAEGAPRIVEAICGCLDWQTGSLWVPDRHGSELACVGMWNRPSVSIPRFREETLGRRFAVGRGLPGRIWESGTPAWIRDVADDTNFPRAPVAVAEGLHGAVGFPIRLGGETLGVLEFFSHDVREPDDDMLRMMAAVGHQIGQFLERKRAEDAVREGAERLRFALEAARTWTWEADLGTGTFSWSENLAPLLGLPDERRQASEEDLLETIHPDDRERVREAYRRAVEEGAPYDVEYRVLARGRTARWIAVRGRAIRDEAGRAVRLTGVGTDITERRAIEESLREETEAIEVVNRVGRMLTAELDLEKLVQAVTDAATRLTGAAYGAFFYNQVGREGGQYLLYAISGAPREAFSSFLLPRATGLFGPTFRGEGVVRIDDVGRHPLYGQTPPYHGTPPGHLPVASYLAVPVVSRGGEVLGGLFFGHPEPGIFREREERIVVGLAAQAAIAIDNARLYEAERRARAEAEAANRSKDEFLAMLGHELRNPIGAISNSIYALRGTRTAADSDRLRDVIERQTRRLGRLVDDLLDVARLTSGKVKLVTERCDLGAITRSCVESVRTRSGGKHRLELDAGEPCWVEGDPTRLEQIVDNLLDNAVKYTPEGGRIAVRVADEDGGVTLSVEDDGQGIEAAMVPRIFEVFEQGMQPLDRSRGGLGIGLTLVKRLVELHGGSVEARSEGRGTGSRFVIRLPRREAPAPTTVAHAAPPRPTPRRILLVEDYADARDALRALLELWGHEVDCAATGPEGVEKALRLVPDVAIVDIGLPGLDGYQVAKRIRTAGNGRRPYLVALTGYGQPDDRQQALEAEFDAHLVKPLDQDELAHLLANLP